MTPGFLLLIRALARLHYLKDCEPDTKLPFKSMFMSIICSYTGGAVCSHMLDSSDSAMFGLLVGFLPTMLTLYLLYRRRVRIQDYHVYPCGAPEEEEEEVDSVDSASKLGSPVTEAKSRLSESVKKLAAPHTDPNGCRPIPSGVYLLLMAAVLAFNTVAMVTWTEKTWLGYLELAFVLALCCFMEAFLRIFNTLQFDFLTYTLLTLAAVGVSVHMVLIYLHAIADGDSPFCILSV